MHRKGFTLIEIVLSMAIGIIMLAAFFIVANPGKQFAQTRNKRRQADLNVILNAVKQNIADTRTGFTCAAGDIPTTTRRMAIGAGNYDIASCLVPTYIPTLPVDPGTSSARYKSVTDYDTGYYIIRSSSTTSTIIITPVTVSAPATEGAPVITITR